MNRRNMLHPKWVNPWEGSVGYLFLGRNVIEDGKGVTLHDEDLYALESEMHRNNCISVSFGARFGDEGHQYMSGEAFYSMDDRTWSVMGGDSIYKAAALYFANYHPHMRIPINATSQEDSNPTVKKTGE